MWAIFLLVWVLPWAVYPGVEDPFLEIKLIGFTLLAWSAVLWYMFKLPKHPSLGWKNPITIWLSGWVVAVSVYKFHWHLLQRPPGSPDVIYNAYAWIGCAAFLMVILMVYVLSQGYLHSSIDLQRITQWVCASAALVSLYAVFQWLGFDQWYRADPDLGYAQDIYAGFGNPSYLAIYLAIITPLFFIFSGKQYLAYAALSLFAIYLTKTHYAWVIVSVGIVASLASRWWNRVNRLVKYSFIILLLILAYYLFQEGWSILQTDERLTIWTLILSKISAGNAMTGYGIGSLGHLLGSQYIWAHNSWLNLVVELGIIGTLMTLAMVAYGTRSGWTHAKQNILTSGWFGVWMASLAASLIHFPERVPPIAFVILLAYSVMERTPGELA